MALKAVHIIDVPCLDKLPENASKLSLSSSSSTTTTPRFSHGVEENKENNGEMYELPEKFLVIGHRGNGMNMMQSPDRRMKSVKENSLLSFHAAAKLPVDFIEFDVQVTKDSCPIIFHDNFILTKLNNNKNKDEIIEKRVTDLTLDEFLSYGPQKDPKNVRQPLYRKTKDGRVFEWKVEYDAPFCTLEEVCESVDCSIGFNIELKFDDHVTYKEPDLACTLQAILKVVHGCAKDRPIIISSFQPDAALLTRKLQSTYPVFFLTNGGNEIFSDVRRNSLDEAIKVCLVGGLQGIVSEVKAVLRNPGAVTRIKESNLSLITYGQLNNVPEVVYVQHLMGVGGVIVDFVQEITSAVSDFVSSSAEEAEKPRFSQHELSFLLKLIPEPVRSSSH